LENSTLPQRQGLGFLDESSPEPLSEEERIIVKRMRLAQVLAMDILL
jgi:hypothetical protein